MDHLFSPFFNFFNILPSNDTIMVELENAQGEVLMVNLFYLRQAIAVVGRNERVMLKMAMMRGRNFQLVMQVLGESHTCTCRSWEQTLAFAQRLRDIDWPDTAQGDVARLTALLEQLAGGKPVYRVCQLPWKLMA